MDACKNPMEGGPILTIKTEQKQRLADAVRHHQASSTGVHDQSEGMDIKAH